MSDFMVIAGPCAIQTREQTLALARAAKEAGATHFRGCVYKPRTSPSDFQGVGELGFDYLNEARALTGLPYVTEAVGEEQVELVFKQANMIQVGARNMQNSELLKRIAEQESEKPLLLKLGWSANLDEIRGSIDYLVNLGHRGEIILCDRGVRVSRWNVAAKYAFDEERFIFLKESSSFGYRVLVDPSHIARDARKVVAVAEQALVGKPSGLVIEFSDGFYLSEAKSDKRQHLTSRQFGDFMHRLRNEKIIPA